jgi:hypothetical protein
MFSTQDANQTRHTRSLLQYISLCLCGKVKLFLNLLFKHHPVKTYGEWRYSSTIFDRGTRWKWVVKFTFRPLYPRGNHPRYPLDRRLGGSQRRSGRYGVENNFYPCRKLNSDRLARSPSLYGLSYPGSYVSLSEIWYRVKAVLQRGPFWNNRLSFIVKK